MFKPFSVVPFLRLSLVFNPKIGLQKFILRSFNSSSKRVLRFLFGHDYRLRSITGVVSRNFES